MSSASIKLGNSLMNGGLSDDFPTLIFPLQSIVYSFIRSYTECMTENAIPEAKLPQARLQNVKEYLAFQPNLGWFLPFRF